MSNEEEDYGLCKAKVQLVPDTYEKVFGCVSSTSYMRVKHSEHLMLKDVVEEGLPSQR